MGLAWMAGASDASSEHVQPEERRMMDGRTCSASQGEAGVSPLCSDINLLLSWKEEEESELQLWFLKNNFYSDL